MRAKGEAFAKREARTRRGAHSKNTQSATAALLCDWQCWAALFRVGLRRALAAHTIWSPGGSAAGPVQPRMLREHACAR